MKKKELQAVENKNNNYIFVILTVVMIIVVPLITSGLTLNPFNAVKTLTYRIFILIFISIFFLKNISSDKISLSGSPLLLPLSIFLIIGLCSSVNATNIYVFFDSFFELFLSAMFSLVFIQVLKKEYFKYISIVSSAVGTLISSIGIYQYYSAESFNLANSVRSTLGHSNFLAHYLIIVIPLTLSLILYSKKMSHIIIFSSFFLCQTTALALTFARGAWIASVASIIIFGAASIKISTKNKSVIFKKIIIFLIVAILLTAGIAATKPHVFKALFIPFDEMQKIASGEESEFKYKIVTILVRLEMWKGTIEMIESNPVFGVGLGNYWIVSQKFRTPNELKMDYDMLKWAHNDFLQIGAETGFFGLGAFLFLLIAVFNNGFRKLKECEKEERLILTGFICALAATVIHAMVSFNFYNTVPVMYFWITAAILMGKNKKELNLKLPRSFLYKGLLSSIFLIATFYGIYLCSSQFIGEAYFSKAEKYSVRKEWEKSIPLLKTSLSFSPNNAKFRYALALSYFKTGNFKPSIEECNKAYLLTPNVSDINRLLGYAHNELGNVFFEKNKYSKALIEYNRVIETAKARMNIKLRPYEVGILVKELSNAYYNRANLYKLTGNYRKAKDDYKKAIQYNPRHYLASKELEKINLMLNSDKYTQPEYP